MDRESETSSSEMTTSEARRSLPTLVRRAAQRRKPGRTLRANAVEIQPRGETRSALLIPEVDVAAAERYISELEETIEDIELMRLVEERVVSGSERGLPLAEVIRDLGQEDLLGDTAPA